MNKFDFETIADSIDYGFGTDFSMEHTMMAGAQLHVKTAPSVIRALKGLSEAGLFGWTPSDEQKYIDATVNWMKTVREWNVRKDWIVPSYGILQAMCTSIRAFTDPGDGIIIQPPVYLLYARAIDRCGRNLVNNPLVYKGDHWEMDFVDLEEKMRRPENKLMLLCNPHNPTMDVWEKKDLERVARLAAKYHVLVVVDEIYAEHVWEEGLMVPYGALSDAEHNCIVCTSLGKSFNFTGTSHANIIIPDDAIRGAYITQRNSDHYGSLSPFMRAALLGGYTKEGKEWIDALMEFSGENEKIVRDFFAENFPKVHFCRHRAGTLLWADFREMGTEEEVYAWFQKAGVEPDLGSKYGEEGRGFLRLQIGMPKRELNYALERIKKVTVHG